jgi:hypothetical protein
MNIEGARERERDMCLRTYRRWIALSNGERREEEKPKQISKNKDDGNGWQ